MEPIKILIGIPDNRTSFEKPFVKSLFPLLAQSQEYFRRALIDGREYGVDICWAERGDIDRMRNAIAKSAIGGGYTYILWMDSDMTFPADMILRMLSHFEGDESIEAVSGLYTYKTYPFVPHVYPKYDATDRTFFVGKKYPLDRPFFVDGVGFGCLMMKVSVFARLERPYFTSVFEDDRLVVGEDLGFCIKASMKTVLDPQIRCGHLHQQARGIEDYLQAHGLSVDETGMIQLTPEQSDRILAAMPNTFKIVNE